MTKLRQVPCGIEAIFFDINGTLRVREQHDDTQRAASRRVLELLGKEDASDTFWEELTSAHMKYSQWAQNNLLQLSEKEIWSGWLLPNHPREQIEAVAAELTLAWMERKGRTVPRPEAEETLIELKRRGYRLGVISNSMSSLDIPHGLEDYGWKEYFEVVILSSVVKRRKPAPEPFWEAAHALKVEPNQCAYIGNRISKDVVGCKRAGFAFGIILEPPGGLSTDEREQTIQPEAIIHTLNELLDIFPERVPPQPRIG